MKHRRRTRLWVLFAAFALGLVVLPTGMASATVGTMQIAVDTTLTEDHNGQIEIIADNVTLDCGNHKVTGIGSGIGIGAPERSGVTVRNCHVSGFHKGIQLWYTTVSLFTGNTVTDNTSGILLFFSDESTISDNTLTNNGVDGLGIYESSLVTVTGNTIAGNTSFGMKVLQTDTSVFTGNHVSDSGSDGFHVNKGAVGNTFSGNTANDNAEAGIKLVDSDSNTLSENVTNSNAEAGIKLVDSDSNTLSENVTNSNGKVAMDDGIALYTSDNNTIARNRASGNSGTGFFTDGTGNAFTDNESHRNSRYGFHHESAAGANSYSGNHCTANQLAGSEPSGLCQEERVGLVDTSSGMWYLRHSEDSGKSFYYGNPGDVPFMGDWDCNEEATPGLFRQSDAFAYLRNSNSQGIADIRFFFGNPSDVPLAGDFNGDGCDTLSIYRPSEARFYIINKLGENEGGLGAAEYSFLFGNPGDKPVVGDWDGDGVDEIGLHRETSGFFYYRNTLTTGIADGQFFFGDPGDRFVSGDWGVVDGVDTPAMFRPSNSTFYFRWTLTQGNADSEFVWTGAGMNWLPVSGEFTLD